MDFKGLHSVSMASEVPLECARKPMSASFASSIGRLLAD